MSYRHRKCIIYVASFALMLAANIVVHAGSKGPLTVAGYQSTDQAVVVSVRNSGAVAEQGVVSLLIRLRGKTHVTATALSVPAGATIPVVFEVPRDWTGSRLKIDVLIATDGDGDDRKGKKDKGEGEPSDTGGNPHSGANQITEGPDTVGG